MPLPTEPATTGNTSTTTPSTTASSDREAEAAASAQHPSSMEASAREAFHRFFYPSNNEDTAANHRSDDNNINHNNVSSPNSQNSSHRQQFDEHFQQQAQEDRKFVEHFWTTYDDIIILAIMTQVGIVFRLASATWFAIFDDVFSNDSALFVNLPLNCLSCFLMGLLCSGDRLMEIVVTRFSPPRLQIELQRQRQQEHEEFILMTTTTNQNHHNNQTLSPLSQEHPDHRGEVAGMEEDDFQFEHTTTENGTALTRRRRRRHRLKQDKFFRAWQPPTHLDDDLRDVQLLALERRIRASKCLLLFPVKKEDIDVMEHYFQEGYKKEESESEGQELGFDLALEEGIDHPEEGEEENHGLNATPSQPSRSTGRPSARDISSHTRQTAPLPPPLSTVNENDMDEVQLGSPSTAGESTETDAPQEIQPQDMDINQMVNDISANVQENISTLQRVNLAEGWDRGTTAEAMSEDLLLGLRDGFCGALSSFSSWNSAMVNLLRGGSVGTAFVGYMLGLQLPIVAYRFGQHVALYIFIWRCRRETKRDERRGYGIRVATNEESDRDHSEDDPETAEVPKSRIKEALPSVRAIATAVFIMALVTQVTSLSFFSDPANEQLALSLLFSPLGVWARWRLSKYNDWRPGFPIGTFTSNILACALSGGFGSLLAGNPGDQERIVLQSFINGFGGTLSSLATFIVEILAGTDPILLRFDGIWYAVLSLFWAMVTGFIFSASVDWADETG